MSTRNSYFMADFAATDRRSVRAHINGTSLRAKVFSGFSRVAAVLGRGDRAAADYKAISRFVFRLRDALVRAARRVGHGSVAVIGLAAGVALYFVL